MSKIRKALVAAVTAAAGAVLSAITANGVPSTSSGWLALLSGAAGIGLAALLAVYAVPNAPTVRPPADGSMRRD